MRIAAAALLLAATAGTAAADRTDRTCQRAHRSAVQLEETGHLIEARDQLASCAQQGCGRFLEHQCTLGLDRLDTDIPTIIPVVLDAAGEPVVDAKVTMDGELLTSEVTGRALPVDPGVHELTATTGEDAGVTRRVIVSEGRRNRKIIFHLPAEGARLDEDRPAPRGAPRKRASAAVAAAPAVTAASGVRAHRASALPGYLLASAGVIGVGGWGLLSWWGRKDNELLARCAPDCAQSDVDHIHTLYLAADVSLGVGVTALAAGAWMIWRSHSTYTIEVSPTGDGAVAGLSGVF
jgi:hypothetical protein